MKVSQLIHAMDKDDEIVIDDFDSRIANQTIYSGAVRGITKDNPINKMHIIALSALDDVIYVCARKQREKV